MKLIELSIHKSIFVRLGFWSFMAIVTFAYPTAVFKTLELGEVGYIGAFITMAIYIFIIQKICKKHFESNPENKKNGNILLNFLIFKLTIILASILAGFIFKSLAPLVILFIPLYLPDLAIGFVTYISMLPPIINSGDSDVGKLFIFIPVSFYLIIYSLAILLLYNFIGWINKLIRKRKNLKG